MVYSGGMRTGRPSITEATFGGYRCLKLPGPDGEAAFVTVDRGPRIIGLVSPSGRNLFAELPESGVDGPAGRFDFLGGHRLWVAPEIRDRAYLPDGAPCRVDDTGEGVTVTAPDNGSGLERAVTVTATPEGFTIDHTIENVSWTTIDGVAAWAITQMPIGGTAVVPFQAPPGADTLQGSHALVFWPYSNPTDERLVLRENCLLVEATDEASVMKIGVRPGGDRFGYLMDGTLFTKQSDPAQGDTPDLGAASQVYTSAKFIELETLGPLSNLQPGASISHQERWTVVAVEDLSDAIDHLRGNA